MLQDLMSVIRKTSEFLGVNHHEDTLVRLVDHLSFQNMKGNPSVNYNQELLSKRRLTTSFMRVGISGDWRNHLDHIKAKDFDRWTRENLRGIELPFKVLYI